MRKNASRLARPGRNVEAFLTEPAGNTAFDLKPVGPVTFHLTGRIFLRYLKMRQLRAGVKEARFQIETEIL